MPVNIAVLRRGLCGPVDVELVTGHVGDLLERGEHLPQRERRRREHGALCGARLLGHGAQVAALVCGRADLRQRATRALTDGFHQVRLRYAWNTSQTRG